MRSKTNLLFAPLLVSIALCFTPETAWSEETAPTTAAEDTDSDIDSEPGKKRIRTRFKRDTALSLAAIAESSTTVEAERVVVHGLDPKSRGHASIPGRKRRS